MSMCDEFEIEQAEQRNSNEILLSRYTVWLESFDVSKKTVINNVSNVEFYINEYLLHSEIIRPSHGCCLINDFLGYWFPRKAMWASPKTMKGNCASLKKFYTFMLEKNEIDNLQLIELNNQIKQNKKHWLSCYNNQSSNVLYL